MYLISACLAGVECRYDGKSNEIEQVKQLVAEGKGVLICPEQLGGLTTPRIPAEIKQERVVTKEGQDVTDAFRLGAARALAIATGCNCQKAILKANSPSCGYGKIYDGNFTKTLICGNGVTAQLLKENGIQIYTEYDLEDI